MEHWIEFVAALALFLGSHPLPQATGLKPWLIARIERRAYLLAYSLISLLLFGWLIAAAGRAPFIPVWDQALWHRGLVNLVMPLAITLAVFGIAAPNPFAFEGKRNGYDPARPGIVGVTRQPLLWAMLLWAGAHLLANGDVAHILLFLPMFLMAVVGLVVAERLGRRRLGMQFAALAAQTGLMPGGALITGRWHPRSLPSLRRLALAMALWAVVWHLHDPVIGVWPGIG